MINQKSLDAVAAAEFNRHFCKPLYASYCFSRIPETIFQLLTGKKGHGLPSDTWVAGDYDVVILFFVDGFGWRFFEHYADKLPFLKKMKTKGRVSKLTAQFPSTTAAHVTCMNTGLNVGQSGVYEWFYYEPKVERVIAPLLFSFAGDHHPGTLAKAGYLPQDFYPTPTFYQKLAQEQITSYILESESILNSHYSQVTSQGAQKIPCASFAEALEKLPELYRHRSTQKAYFYLYFGEIDAMGHRHGIGSTEFEEAVTKYWTLLEKALPAFPKMACLFTADHGMTAVNPSTTFYLNQEMPELLPYFKKGKDGKPLAPAGSCRDFFLHIEEGVLNTVHEQLEERLGERALICSTEKLMESHFFGEHPPSQTLRDRIGNLVILPYLGESVWWREKPRFDQHFFAMHGGLTREEMEIPFLFLT